MHPTEILNPTKRRSSKAYLVNELRKAVYKWRREKFYLFTDNTGNIQKKDLEPARKV